MVADVAATKDNVVDRRRSFLCGLVVWFWTGNRGRKPCRAVWPANDGDAVWRRSPSWRRRFRLPLSFPNHIFRVKTLLRSERAVAAIHVSSSLGAPLWRNLFVQGLSKGLCIGFELQS
uniref:Uncharacterized protein n=1 Tax=Oryza rufipogon TaxID=4529 RepID=A0A0E0PGK9_ORYRU